MMVEDDDNDDEYDVGNDDDYDVGNDDDYDDDMVVVVTSVTSNAYEAICLSRHRDR